MTSTASAPLVTCIDLDVSDYNLRECAWCYAIGIIGEHLHPRWDAETKACDTTCDRCWAEWLASDERADAIAESAR